VIARRRLTLAAAAVACALLGACSFGAPPPDQSGAPPNLPTPSASLSPSSSAGATVDVVTKNLPAPWGIAFLPDGSAVVTERIAGTIVHVTPSESGPATVKPVTRVPGVNPAGDGGLLGIAVSPQYATDQTLYVYYSTATDNRIASIHAGGAPHVLVTGIPHGTTDNGGGLAFGPDGLLYAATGDAGKVTGGVKAPSQDHASLAGKVLRMTVAGKPAAGTSLVYASGFHDVEGLAWDLRHHLFVVDAGRTSDNLDVVVAGGNYGWPIAGTTAVPATAHLIGPIQTFTPETSGCAGIGMVDDVVATACPTGQRMWLAQVAGNATVLGAPGSAMVGQFGRLRGLAAASDGSLWVMTSNTDSHGTPKPGDDQILRVVLDDTGAGMT
jgi:glucose/arabinose dehydrogenase